MRALLDDLASPSWWIGVVLVGIAINITSAWLMRGQAAVLARTSKWLATLTEKRRIERTRIIQEMRESSIALQLMSNRVKRNHSLASIHLIVGFQGLFGTLLIMKESPFLALPMVIFAGYLTISGLRIILVAENQYHMVQAATSHES